MSIDTNNNSVSENTKEETKPASAKADENTEASEASEDLDASESDAQDSDENSEDGESKEGEDRPKKKNGFKRRIDKLNKQKSDAMRELEYWRSVALKGKDSQEPQQKTTSKTETVASDKPNKDEFETYEEYFEALTDWKVEQKEKQREVAKKNDQLKSDYQKRREAHNKRVADFQKATPDYKDVVEEFLEDRGNDFNVSVALDESIMSSEFGPQLVYELFKDPKEFDRINSLSPLAIAKEIGKIEARLSKDSNTTKETKTTKAPQPLKPVGSFASGGSKKSITDPDISMAEYTRLRREQAKRRA